MNPPLTQGVPISIRGLRQQFKDVEVLHGIDLEIAAGELFVLMGPSGSGKTVLLRQIIGLDHPESGEVLVGERAVHSEDFSDHVRMAMVFQSSALLNSLTVVENVGLYLTEHRRHAPSVISEIVAEKLHLVGLTGAEDKLPSELSGGMRKRVAIARALTMEPQVILFDEPTSELDPLRSVTIGREILALNQRLGVTAVVVTHDRDLALGVADRIAFLHEGQVRFVGSPDTLRDHDDPLIRNFLTIDFKTVPATERLP